MARHKVIKPEDRKYKLAKKRHRICNTVYGIYIILYFAILMIGAIDQNNPAFVGWTFIAMGIISIPVVIFRIYTRSQGWEPQLMAWAQESSNIEIEEAIVTFIIILFSVVPLVLGILKLYENF